MTTRARFAAASRLLHWLMAPMIITMLFIGVGMAALYLGDRARARRRSQPPQTPTKPALQEEPAGSQK